MKMSFNTDISTKLENSRNSLKKIARNDNTEFSKQSVMNDMEKFVKAVTTMDETVLVPSRLMDLEQEGDDDPFSLYAMLNDLKTELLWAGEAEEQVERGRRISDLSDTESDASSAAGDSGIDGEDERESAARSAAACRRHLRGLRHCLRHLTAAAAQLTRSYQEEVGAPV
ncbi:thyroid hormone-inducible hepatic protein [Maniola jurtina]|uniref:thyroid hormone-inducible hepatic protein n=1 Tax=Maniola jurtina TaxID=191418 RepID=UPI001E688914|nr:thyroid hormone-inducible hepatic protein [Maniola jurtina]